MPKDLSGRNVQTGGGQGEVKPSYMKSMNKYPKLTHKIYTTARYGHIFPTFCFHGTRGDKVPLNSSHELDTYTLKSPLKSDVRFNKTYVKVPYKAIYPHNWDLMRVPPTTGDDVPGDTRALFDVGKFYANIVTALCSDIGAISSFSGGESSFNLLLTEIIKLWISAECVASEGSLFSAFNMHVSKELYSRLNFSSSINKRIRNFDNLFDDFFTTLINNTTEDLIFEIEVGNEDDLSTLQRFVVVKDIQNTSLSNAISFRTALDLMRDENFVIISAPDIYTNRQRISFEWQLPSNIRSSSIILNIEPIIAYQLSCYQFFTDDKVDFIYDAENYRRCLMSYYKSVFGSNAPFYYTWNAYEYEYDVFSQHYFDKLMDLESFTSDCFVFSILLFSHRRSLRYKDYFTSSRPQPLANGEYYSAEVNENSVSAVDMARSMQRVRFYHNVSLAGRRLADYLQMIVPGSRIEASDEQPHWLAHESFVLKGFEVENTGDAQLSTDAKDQNIITTNLKSTASKFSFMTQVDDQCIILGLGSFDIARVYSKTISRFAFHQNRYDDFIPQLQFIGDQEISTRELGMSLSIANPSPFGYQVRNKEYKEMVNYATGGFVNNLPSWAMVTDNSDGVPASDFINSLYIRAVPSEFDRFYKSLTGYSLANYFHFILVIKNDLTNCERAMIPAPEILK